MKLTKLSMALAFVQAVDLGTSSKAALNLFFGGSGCGMAAEEMVYSDCENSNNGATDSYGDNCSWYDYYPDGCGQYDTSSFDAHAMCCACAGHPTNNVYDATCTNSDNGATDAYGDGCEWYDMNSWGCGSYDDGDFHSMEMCCVCS